MPRHQDSAKFTTAEKAENHDNLMPLLNSMYHEFQELSKKKPDGVLKQAQGGNRKSAAAGHTWNPRRRTDESIS